MRFKDFYNESSIQEIDFRKQYAPIKFALKDMKNPPNTLQLAIASIAVQLLPIHQKQFHGWSGGAGKSRIMASIGMLALITTKKYSKIRFVFTNKLLMQKDLADFRDVWHILSLTNKVQYHVGFTFTP